MNQAWVTGEYEAIGQHVAEHVVMAPPGWTAGSWAAPRTWRRFASSPRWPGPVS